MKTQNRTFFVTAVMTVFGATAFLMSQRSAEAYPTYYFEWLLYYPSSSSGTNVETGTGQGCALCHFSTNGGSNWNGYGWKIREGLHASLSLSDAFDNAGIPNSDSDPMAATNLFEINADTQPGWTPGPHNTRYLPSGTQTGLNPPAGILGGLDPSAITSYCFGDGTLPAACPCSNTGMAGHGCDNSSSTGGAILTASGVASLAADTLQLTSSGEKPTATSIFLQGNATLANGTVFGQGLRCATGALKRLYVKNAVGGVVVAPVGADLDVHTRSAAAGDTILPSTNRYYQTYYRDPTVLGGCSSDSTFNVSQALAVMWTL